MQVCACGMITPVNLAERNAFTESVCVCVCLVTLTAFNWVKLQIEFIPITNVRSLFSLIPSLGLSVLPARCRCVRAAEFETAHFEDGVCLHKQGWLLDNYFFSLSLPCTRASFHPDLSAY